jgi:thiol-disulfide isomerase/thioredoxin
MIATAFLIFTNYDKVLEAKLLNIFPAFSNIQTKFESNNSITNALNQIKNNPSHPTISSELLNTNTPAPDFTGITNWINSQPLNLAELKGKVVLVDFWTYTCINCIRTLPYTTGWYNKYKDQGFVVVGVHTPEFDFEKETANVERAIKQYGILYPVAQDNNYSTWNAYSNQYWPAEYLIDINGNVRRVHFGEGEYDKTEEAIKMLLKESGKKTDESLIIAPDQTPSGQLSPESYLGSKRMQYYSPNGSLSNGTYNFTLTIPSINSFSFGGKWAISDESSKALDKAKLSYNFFADKVYLVMGPGQGSSKVKVYLDGKLIDANSQGSDVKNGEVLIDSQRLYSLVDLKSGPEEHSLELIFDNGVSVFAFTFG